MKKILQFSGGKDSLATGLYLFNSGIKDFDIVFCDTGNEHQLTINYISECVDKFKEIGWKGNFQTLYPVLDFHDLIRKQRIFPSSRKRYCTDKLKIRPFTDYVLDHVKDHFIVYQGIRAQESLSRSKLPEECVYWDLENKKLRIYRIKDIRKFKQEFSDEVRRPIFRWSAMEVVNYILDNGFEMNPLYSLGQKRVGCFPCVLSGPKEVKQIYLRFPWRIQELIDLEKEVFGGYFENNLIPERFWSGVMPGGSKYCTVQDVVDYTRTTDEYLFPELAPENMTCMSYYNLCE